MTPLVRTTCALAIGLGLLHTIGHANGVPAPTSPGRPAPRTPEERAVEAYNKGLDNRNRGIKAEERAAKSSKASDRVENEQRARNEFEKALRNFEEAAAQNPSLPQAWNGMGYAYRKLGEFDKSLEAYDRALTLAPNFPDALEYRGETYLAMNRVEEAKQSYLAVFAIDRKQAELLMRAMTSWVAQRKADPAGVAPEVVSGLETWIVERSAIARQTRLMERDSVYRFW